MYSDIMEVLQSDTGQDADMVLTSPSLAEHSYCASSSVVTSGTCVSDLLAGSTQLPTESSTDETTSTSFPIIEIGDVNLDGFDYSVPFVSGDGRGDSLESENRWDGLINGSSVEHTVVEVSATQENQLTDNMEIGDGGRKRSLNSCGTGNGNGSVKRLKRRDFIRNKEKRRLHFDTYYRKLVGEFNRIKSRTGCGGTLSAMFEGGYYTSYEMVQDCSSNPSILHSNETGSSIYHNGTCMHDHRYAATILTQKVSSSAVRDHQYDEKTVTSHETDTDNDDEDETTASTGSKVRVEKKPSSRYRSDFIKVRWARTYTFCKVARTLFINKIALEHRTGVNITLRLEYEGNIIDENNYENANAIISSQQKEVLKAKGSIAAVCRKIAPAPGENTPLPMAPLSFLLPFQNHCVLSKPSHLLGTEASFGNIIPVTMSVPSETRNASFLADTMGMNTDPVSGLLENGSLENENTTPLLNPEMPEDREDEESNNLVGRIFLPDIPVTSVMAEYQDTTSNFNLENDSFLNSPEIAVARGMKESATNTEPICSICFSGEDEGESSGNSTRSYETRSLKSFWIRCNDPFCYNMVHTSCVGFVVTHIAHLKQLPAYYCKSHR